MRGWGWGQGAVVPCPASAHRIPERDQQSGHRYSARDISVLGASPGPNDFDNRLVNASDKSGTISAAQLSPGSALATTRPA